MDSSSTSDEEQMKDSTSEKVVIDTQKVNTSEPSILVTWSTNYSPIPLATENAILPLLMQYGKNEHGMFKYQKQYRLQKVKHACRKHRIRLDQALSLRRHHINNLNPYYDMGKLGLGSNNDIKVSSEIFEGVLESYLKRFGVEYISEAEQLKQFRQRCKDMKEGKNKEHLEKEKKEKKKNNHFLTPPTPDFLLCQSIQIEKHIQNHSKETFEINFIDAKMYYGASSIQQGSKNAVGSLLAKAQKYVEHYGQGAFVFFNGYGEELEKMLLEHGVISLDAKPLDLRRVFDHQRTWCANKSGDILP